MPTPANQRDYRREAKMESPERKEARRTRMRDRYSYEQKHGDLPTSVQVDHKKALSQGGSSDPSNLRAIPKKKNESFNRAGPGGKQIGKA